jgi:hypothetical protein
MNNKIREIAKAMIWSHKTSFTPPLFSFFLSKCLYQAMKVSGHVMLWGINVASFYDCSIGIQNCSGVV